MSEETKVVMELENVSPEVLAEIMQRVQDIDNSYRGVIQKMGQLYMCADEHKVMSLTRGLDKPMRNASDNEQMFAAIFEEIRIHASQRQGA